MKLSYKYYNDNATVIVVTVSKYGHKKADDWLESISNGQIWGVYRPKGAPIDHNLATKSVKCPPSPGGDNFPPARAGNFGPRPEIGGFVDPAHKGS